MDFIYTMTPTDWLGFAGVTLLLIAYFLNVRGTLANDSVLYLLLNTLGAGVACLSAVLLVYYPFIVLEGVWTLVSLLGLLRAVLKK